MNTCSNIILVGTLAANSVKYYIQKENGQVKKAMNQYLRQQADILIEQEETSQKILKYLLLQPSFLNDKTLIEAIIPIGKDGLLAALWRLGQEGRLGMNIYLDDIKVLQEVIEVLEIAGLSPYEADSDGCLLVCSANGYYLTKLLEQKQITAAVIGYLKNSNDRVIISGESRRFLTRPDKS